VYMYTAIHPPALLDGTLRVSPARNTFRSGRITQKLIHAHRIDIWESPDLVILVYTTVL
jgi:hypothetical protein